MVFPAISWPSPWSSSYWLDHEWFTLGSYWCTAHDVWPPPDLVLVCCLLCWLHAYSPSNFFVPDLIHASFSCSFCVTDHIFCCQHLSVKCLLCRKATSHIHTAIAWDEESYAISIGILKLPATWNASQISLLKGVTAETTTCLLWTQVTIFTFPPYPHSQNILMKWYYTPVFTYLN